MTEEVKKLKDLVVLWIEMLVVTACFFFFFGLTAVSVFGFTVSLPALSGNSFSVLFFKMMQLDLLPGNVTLVAMGPLSALNTQGAISFLLAFLVTFPFFLCKLAWFVSPALHKAERRMFLSVLLPTLALFAGGVLFAYKFVIPSTLKALYDYTSVTGATPFFSIDSFVSSVVTFMIVTGVLFLIPVFMILLSFLGIIPSAFWRDKWRYALLTFLIFSAIITPDGSGISMMLLSLPLSGLYAVGIGVASMKKQR